MPTLEPSNILDLDSLPNLSRQIQPIQILAETFEKAYFKPLRQLSESIGRMVEVQNKLFIQTIPRITLQLPTLPMPLIFNSPTLEDKKRDYYKEGFKRTYHRHPNFWLEETSDGRFTYKGRLVGKISVGSKVGMFLSLLIDDDYNFVSDKEVKQEIELSDKAKGIGFIKNDLIKTLKHNGIEIKLERIRNVGNKILKVSKSTN